MSVLEQERIAEREFRIDFPFHAKAVGGAKKGDLVLEGYASTWMEDRDGETIDKHAFDEDLPTYLNTNPILLLQHSQDMPLGQIIDATLDDRGLRVKAIVPKPSEGMSSWKFDAYNDIARGVLCTFSIGGLMQRELRWPMNPDGTPNYDMDPKVFITRVMLLETSCVSIPANPGSLYEAAVKSIKGAAVGPVLTDHTKEQMAQLLGMKAVTDDALIAMNDEERDRYFDALTRLYQRCGLVAPERDAWSKAVDVLEKATSARTMVMATIPPLMLTLGMVETGRAGNVSAESREAAADEVTDSLMAALDGKALLPLADKGRAWDASAARSRVKAWAGADDGPNAKYGRAFFHVSGDRSSFGSYKLPFADVINGTLTAIPRGIYAAAAAVQGARGAGPYPPSVKSKIAAYYSKLGEDPPWKGSSLTGSSDKMAQIDAIKQLGLAIAGLGIEGGDGG